MSGYLQVSTAAADREEAVDLAASAVKQRLAAAAEVTGPVTSIFWHLGEYGESEEWKVTLKTTEARYAELEAHLLEKQSWENPEVSSVQITGSRAYLDWLDRATTAS